MQFGSFHNSWARSVRFKHDNIGGAKKHLFLHEGRKRLDVAACERRRAKKVHWDHMAGVPMHTLSPAKNTHRPLVPNHDGDWPGICTKESSKHLHLLEMSAGSRSIAQQAISNRRSARP